MESKIKGIILRVLAGESSPEDDRLLMNWISENKDNLQVFSETETLWNVVDIILNRHRFDTDKAFTDFRSQIRAVRSKRTQFGSGNIRKMLLATTRRAAIIILLLSMGGLIGYFGLKYLGSDAEFCEVIVPTGARSNIKLPDGTSVWLNADSKLQYSRSFNAGKRIVFLTGEGYFEVAQNPNKPFIVKTSEIEITALGTKFNVKSYPGEDCIQTTLIEGLVMVNRDSDIKRINSVILEPDQQATYFKKSGELTKEMKSEIKDDDFYKTPEQALEPPPENKIVLKNQVDAKVFTAWKDNSLIFNNESFKSISVKLERRFGVHILFDDDEVMNYCFSGRFDNISIEQALGALKYASPFFSYTIEKDSVFINRNKND